MKEGTGSVEACEPVSVMLGGSAVSEGEGSISMRMEDMVSGF